MRYTAIMKDRLTIIAALFVVAIMGAVISASPESFSFGQSDNLAGAATYSQEKSSSIDDEQLLAVLEEAKHHDKPLLIVTEYEYNALDVETRQSHYVYITSN